MEPVIKVRNRNLYATGLAGIGMVFCAASGLGLGQDFCITPGCTLTKEVAFLGLSLWWWGAGAFLVVAVLAVLGRGPEAYWAGFAALAADAGLLLWMALTAPCLTCLFAGFLFLFLFYSLCRIGGKNRTAARVLTAIWFFVLAPNFFGVVVEMVDPWPIYGRHPAVFRVYFSPTCPACRNTVFYLRPRLKASSPVAFYPVARTPQDLGKIRYMVKRQKEGLDFFSAYAESTQAAGVETKLGMLEEIRLRLRLHRNKIAFWRTGMDAFPVLVRMGSPAVGARPKSDQPSPPGQ
ncbi:MAG: hypothetical protein AB1896_13445 [Thermodesulfobacteriota bacterium]